MNLLSVLVLAFAFQVAQPVPDPIPDAVVEGSVVDIIAERRIDAMMQKLEAQQQSLIEKAAERIEQQTKGKLAELADAVKSIRDDRDGIGKTIAEFRDDRKNMLGLFGMMSERFAEMMQKMFILDRLSAWFWRLVLGVVVLCVLVVGIGLTGLFLYSRLKSFVLKEISSISTVMKLGN
jgi:hypothetical protein